MKSVIKSIEKVSVEFNKQKALAELEAAEREYKNASSAASKALSKYKKLHDELMEALEDDCVIDSLRDDMDKARERYEITSARKAKASIARREAYIHFHTH